MSLISPKFDVESIFFFPILARGLFPKLLEKALKLHPYFVRLSSKSLAYYLQQFQESPYV